MKNFSISKIFFSIAFMMLLAISVSAQNGKVVGKVTDKSFNEPIVSLPVIVKGVSKAFPTNVDGRYEITLAPGTYTLEFKYISFKTKTISEIVVKAGKVTEVNVVMDDAATELGEVIVTSTYKKETVNALFSIQKNNVSISSGISADIIKKSPDKNTSEVLKRVSGTSIQDNKFVIVRGLADRYNASVLNKSILPSSEPDRKAFSFDIIPSNLIDRIIINKTATPEMSGDFAGGIVQVTTKDIPDNNFLSFGTSLGYNTLSTFKDFVSNERNSTDWLGFDDGTRKFPSSFPGTRQEYNSLSAEQKAQESLKFPNSFPEKMYSADPIQSYQLTLGLNKQFKSSNSFGSIISLSYRNQQNINSVDRANYLALEKNPVYSVTDGNNKYYTGLGGLANFAYTFGQSKIAFKNVFNHSFDEIYLKRNGFNINALSDVNQSSNQLNVKDMLNSQLEGEHLVTDKGTKVDWNLNYSYIGQDQPDLRTLAYQRDMNSSNTFSYDDDRSQRFFSYLKENDFGGGFNFSLPFTLWNQKSNFKFGGLALSKDRSFEARNLKYIYVGPGGVSEEEYTQRTQADIFSSQYISTNGFIVDDITTNTDSYTGKSNLLAGYFMFDNKFGEKWKLVWGLRTEYFKQELDAIDVSTLPIHAENKNVDLLPSANLSYSVNGKSNLRFSGSRTVSRPEFRELAPFAFFNYITTSVVSGNPNLDRALIDNIDLRYELYPTAGEAFTFSAFYKNFTGPIEMVTNNASNADLIYYEFKNADKAYAFGVELDVRKNLNFISERLKNMLVFANASFIKSEVNIANQQKRPLQGQSPYLINAGLQYNSPASDFGLSLLYNRIGHRIYAVGFGNGGYPDIYENGRNVLDFQISKGLMAKRAELKLNVSDILNSKSIFYQNLDGSSSGYKVQTDRIMSKQQFGTTFSLAFSYNFNLDKK